MGFGVGLRVWSLAFPPVSAFGFRVKFREWSLGLRTFGSWAFGGSLSGCRAFVSRVWSWGLGIYIRSWRTQTPQPADGIVLRYLPYGQLPQK